MPPQDDNSIDFSAPGFSARVKGAAWTSKEVMLALVMVGCTAFILLERWQSRDVFTAHHATTQGQNLVTQNLLASVLKGQAEALKETRESAEIQAYVLSLPQQKREQLNLSMPPTLRSRIRSNTQ